MKRIFRIFILTLFVLTLLPNTFSQADRTASEVSKWFKKREWLNGLRLNPHKSINRQEFAKQYQAHKDKWDKAFRFLKETDLMNLKPGKYPIDGENVFATVTEAPSKEFAVSEWESHRKYQDIQLIIRGKEKIGTTPVSALSVRDVYKESIDAAFYNGEGMYYLAAPGTFFIFFPGDAHRPNIKVKNFEVVKKIVVKVKTE